MVNFSRRATLALLLSFVSALSWSQTYPTRPVQVIVAFPPATGTDQAARIITDKMSALLGQQFILINKPGAGGTLAASLVLAAPADGYTLFFNSSGHTLYPSVYPDLKFDTARDFVGVGPVGEVEGVLVTPAHRKWTKLSDMVAYARANPGKLTYGSAGVGTNTHLAFERMAAAAKISGLHVPFKGGNEALTEVMAGRLDGVYTTPLGPTLGAIKSGQIVALATRSARRSAALPDVPTSIEAGYPDSDFGSWVGMLASSNVPKPIIERLNGAMLTALKDPDTIARLTAVGIVPTPQTTAQFAAQLANDFEVNAKLMKAINAASPAK